MKLWTFILKDLKVNFRRKLTIFLVLLLPLVILISVAVLFANTTTSLSLGICSNESAQFTDDAIEKLVKISEGSIYKEHCPILEEQLAKGKISAYIQMPVVHNFSELRSTPQVEVFVDSSNAFRMKMYNSFTDMMIRYHAITFGTEYIRMTWEHLQDISSVLEQVNEQTAMIALPILDPESLTLDDSYIDQELELIDQTQADILTAEQQLAYYENAINVELANIAAAQEELDMNKDNVDELYSTISTTLEQAEAAAQVMQCEDEAQNEGCIQILLILRQATTYEEDIKAIILQLEKATTNLEDTRQKLVQLQQDLGTSREKTNQTMGTVEEAAKFLQLLKEKNGQAKDQIAQLNEANADISAFAEELSKNNKLIIDVLTTISTQNSRNILTPLQMKISEYRTISTFESFIPGIIVILIYFLAILLGSMNIVSEERNGTLLNAILMRIPISMIVLSKIIAITFIVVLQILLILLISAVFYGISFTATQLFSLGLYSVLLIIIFLSISLLIAAVGREEFTVIMVSLLFIIPSMFTQGMFIPEQMMNPQIMSIMQLTPSYLANKVITGVFFFDVSIADLIEPLGILFVYALISLGIGVFVMLQRIKETDV